MHAESVRDNEELICPEPDGLFSHPEYCDQYIHCGDGHAPFVGQCSHGLMFNPKLSICDYPANVDCNGKPDSST
jgi:hypothetical protein